MNQSPKVINIKIEPTDTTSSDRLEIPTVMPIESIKQEGVSLVQSDICIKTEPQEDENEFTVTTSAAYDVCPDNDIKVETDEPCIKVECEDQVDDLMQDPLDVSSEIKVPISNSDGETNNKSGQTQEVQEFRLIADDEEFHQSRSNTQDQLFVQNRKIQKNKKYICPVCNKIFGENSKLQRHSLIHSGTKPFTCQICKKSFNQKVTLDMHMLIHSGEKPYICDLCMKDFRDKSTLNKHKLIHSDFKSFSCDECDKSFTHKYSLVVHKRLHTGDKPYTCDLCNKAFTNKSNLIAHKRSHTGEKPFSCDICSKSFTQKSHLNGHKKTHRHL